MGEETATDLLKPKENDFKGFDPGYAGMPFPPFLMNGPQYYKHYSLKVNETPFPTPATKNAYPVAQSHQEEFLKTYTGLSNDFEKLD